MKSTTAYRIAAVVLAAPLALSACSGSDSGTPSSTTTATTTASASLGDLSPGASVDKAKFFDVTKAAAQAHTTYAFATKVGEGGGELTSSGVVDNRDPNNRKRQITLTGDAGESQLVIADGQVFQKSAAVAGGKWVKDPINPALAAVLGGASDRIEQDQSLVQSITYVGDEDVEGTKTRHFTLTVDPAAATGSATTGGASAPTATAPGTASATAKGTGSATPTSTGSATGTGTATPVTVEYWLDDKNRTRKMKHWVAGVPTVTTYDKWGESVTITVPSADQVTTTGSPSAPGSPAPSASASTS